MVKGKSIVHYRVLPMLLLCGKLRYPIGLLLIQADHLKRIRLRRFENWLHCNEAVQA